MVTMLTLKAVESELNFSRSGQTNDYKVGICCFSAKLIALRNKSKDRIMCLSGVTCLPSHRL